MIVFLDSNVYIGAHYHLDTDKFSKLRELIKSKDISVIYTSTTIGEVKAHMEQDIDKEVSAYNRLIRKELSVVNFAGLVEQPEISKEKVLQTFNEKADEFFSLDGVELLSLNPIDAETLMQDYFSGTPPFETKKPHEFKDAIMVHALKRYQAEIQDVVFIISADDGFRRSFEGLGGFICFKYISELLKYVNRQNIIQSLIDEAIENGDADELIHRFLANLDVERGYYAEWECEEHEISDVATEFLYMEQVDGSIYAIVNGDAEVQARITYRDEDSSYYDKEDRCYYYEKYVTALETHRISFEIALLCKISEEDGIKLDGFTIDDPSQLTRIDLDEDTFVDAEIEDSVEHEEPDLVYCSQCGTNIGYAASYSTNTGEPLCDRCMKDDEYGFVCPMCGEKYPNDLMTNGFCPQCAEQYD